jgi:DNA-binding beta-propeller fold protein YncE
MALGAMFAVLSCTVTQDPPTPRAACSAPGPAASALPSLASVPPRQSAPPTSGTILRAVATTDLSGAANVTHIAVDGVRDRVYLLAADGLLTAVNAKTNVVIGSVDVGDLAGGLAVDVDTGRVYTVVTRNTSSSGVGGLAVIDGPSMKVAEIVESSAAASFVPRVVVLNPRTGCLYVGEFSGKLAIVDVRTNTVRGMVDVGGQPIAIAVDAEATRVFVATSGPTNGLAMIDGVSNVVTRSFIGLDQPRAIAVNSNGGRVYLATGTDTLAILDGATGDVRRTLSVMNRPNAIVVDTDRGRIYVANVGSGTVTAVDGVTDEIVGTATVAQAMGDAIAVDHRTGRVYVEEHFTQPPTLKVFER